MLLDPPMVTTTSCRPLGTTVRLNLNFRNSHVWKFGLECPSSLLLEFLVSPQLGPFEIQPHRW